MKHCPSCQSTFSDTQDFCTNDGTRLINDDPASDLGKTLVAPPPAPQSSGTDIPPTQVANIYPGYDNQPPPYAPQYQQPSYAPQGYGAPRSNRKMLYIGIASVVVIAGVVLLIVLLSGSKSLGTYKGSLSDLLPEKVGAYSRATTGTLDDVKDGLNKDAKQFFGYDDARASKYENSGKKMLLIASNFSSPDSAKGALKKIKDQIEKDHDPAFTIKEEGKSKKDGDRAVYSLQPGPSAPQMTIVMWTNGSVVFAVGPDAVLDRKGDRAEIEKGVPSSSDVLDFEKTVPY